MLLACLSFATGAIQTKNIGVSRLQLRFKLVCLWSFSTLLACVAFFKNEKAKPVSNIADYEENKSLLHTETKQFCLS